MCEQECLRSERKVLSPDFKESEAAESFERNCQVCDDIDLLGVNIDSKLTFVKHISRLSVVK